MSRVRLGIALLLPESWRAEVDGLRRALGSSTLERIPPHITLISPINVRVENVSVVLDQVRVVAQRMQPFCLEIGPGDTFAPASPVLMLKVGGAGIIDVKFLRDQLNTGLLKREEQWPYVPHITLHDNVSDELLESALKTLGSYGASVAFDSLVVLRQYDDGVWRPYADACFEPPTKIGTGGFEVEISRSTMLDPCVAEAIGVAVVESTDAFVARVGGVPAGLLVARAWRHFEVVECRVAETQRGLGVGTHLLRVARFRAQELDFGDIEDAVGCPHVTAIMQRFKAPAD